MNADLPRFLALVTAGAVLPVVHVAVAARLSRMASLSWPWRITAWIPPWTLVVALRARSPFSALIWSVAVGFYAVAWALAAR